ncbi:MAG: DUF4433 domain-containing protein [Thermotogae bacterium]|nr:DUF4433 domain-containing protein [Thermotogota bacterium]
MRKARRRDRRRELYYITELENLESILSSGILSRDEVEKLGLDFIDIADEGIVEKRRKKGLSKYANLYIYPRNAMMYRLSRERKDKLIVIDINAEVYKKRGSKVSIGNAASDYSILLDPDDVYLIKLFEKVRDIRDWYSEEAIVDIKPFIKKNKFLFPPLHAEYLFPKTFLQSEILVLKKVPKEHIRAIYVPNENIKKDVMNILAKMNLTTGIEVIVDPDLFFQPRRKVEIYPNLYIVEGDMFDSDLQTLTISVNTVGVMGKGLASRFKYMYPGAFLVYQNIVRRKILKPGRPYLYKPESHNGERWFLFFPTKRHWREKSNLKMICEGLKRFLKFYREEGVKSIAFPALGCGLGGLKWKHIGPAMVNYLKNIDVPVEIYVPMNDLEDEYFERSFYERRIENCEDLFSNLQR